jgi:hypothetical protein
MIGFQEELPPEPLEAQQQRFLHINTNPIIILLLL